MSRATSGSVAIVIGVVALMGAAVLVAVAQTRFGGDLRAFLFLGERFSHPAVLRDVPAVGAWGYDGQFYGALATDPLLLRPSTVRQLDDPGYRTGRIVVPLAAWLLALGHAGAAVWLYIFLCWAGALALIALLAWWLVQHGLSPWWAVLLAASGGVVTAVFRSTPDAVAVFLALLGLGMQQRRRVGAALCLFCLAALARETMLVAALAAALDEAGEKRWRNAILYAAIPGGAFLSWRALVAWRLSAPLLELGGNLGTPLAWVPVKVGAFLSGRLGLLGLEMWGLLAVAAALAACVVVVRKRPLGSMELSFLGYAVLALLLSPSVYADGYAYARVLLPLPALALMVAGRVGAAPRRWLIAVAATSAVVGAVMAVIEVGAGSPWLSALHRRLLG